MPSYPLPTGPGFIRPQGDLHGAGTGSLSQLSATLAPQLALSQNPNRVGAFFYNNTPSNAYICFGTTGSVASWTNLIPPSSSWTIPTPVYVGPVVVFFAANGGVGALMVTEMSSPQNW